MQMNHFGDSENIAAVPAPLVLYLLDYIKGAKPHPVTHSRK